MKRKNRAARAVNAALGIIVILAVVLLSPLFGYARGFSSPEQRAADTVRQTPQPVVQAAAATPRPTPKPTPTPVVLPSAPPTPEPTPQPVHTPTPPAQNQQTNQQTVQQQWTPVQNQEYEEYADEDYGDYEEDGGEDWSTQEDTGGTATENDSGTQIIQNDNFDLVFQDQTTGNSVSVAQGYEPAGEQTAFDFSPDANEGMVIAIP